MNAAELSINSGQTVQAAGEKPGIIILDPAGRLKLVKLRLISDGYRTCYANDISAALLLIEQDEFFAVVLNLDGEHDLDVLRKVYGVNHNLRIIAVMGDKGTPLKKIAFTLGVKKTVNRPIDFPRLSSAVKEELMRLEERKPPGIARAQFNRKLSVFRNIGCEYEFVLEKIKTAVMKLDSSGNIRYINKPMSSLLFLAGTDVSKMHFEQALDNSLFCGPLLSILRTVYKEKVFSPKIDLVVNGPGEPILCEAQAHPVFDPDGLLTGAFLVVEDVSSPRKLEQVLLQSEKLATVGQLAAGAAHEIRNPLTSVRGFIQLLQNELKGTPKAEYINIIMTEIDRVNIIINEFLKLAKPVIPKRKPSDIKTLFEDINMLIESEAFLKNISIRKDLPENLPSILIDVEQVKQVLINVIRNAFEAMSEGGCLTVSAYALPAERQVCMEIKDTGEGMDEATINKVLTPFFTTKENGTGLGLAVSSEIMKSHGGRIEISSAVGRGTTVYLYFSYE